jgi:hypothetical protein
MTPARQRPETIPTSIIHQRARRAFPARQTIRISMLLDVILRWPGAPFFYMEL